MKPILLTLSFLLLPLLTTHAATTPEANPLNIAATLVEKTDSAKVASMLEYYGYTLHDIENGYCVMRHPNGTEIRFTFNENGTPSKYPTVTVKHNETQRDLNTQLKGLDFEKSGNGYERIRNKQSLYYTRCKSGPHSTLIFRHIQR